MPGLKSSAEELSPGVPYKFRIYEAEDPEANYLNDEDRKPGHYYTGSGILAGIRVLDFTRVLSGPLATRTLADFGAEVLKVQSKRPPRVVKIITADISATGTGISAVLRLI